MKVLIVEPHKHPYAAEIDSGLESLRNAIGADLIQCVYPYDDLVGLICDEEGKLTGKELNRALRDSDGYIYDVVAGTFLIAGLTEEDFGSLSDDLIDKYSAMFFDPETFVSVGGKIIVCKE